MTPIRHALIGADTAKVQNADWLATDVQAKRGASFFRITIALTTAVKVRLVPSSGSGFYLNNGDALVANAVLVNDVPFDGSDGRSFNLQTDDAEGCTITHLVVEEFAE